MLLVLLSISFFHSFWFAYSVNLVSRIRSKISHFARTTYSQIVLSLSQAFLKKQAKIKEQNNATMRQVTINFPPEMTFMSVAAVARVFPREMVGSNHLWLLNVCFVGPEVGSDLSDAQLLDRAKLVCFRAVGGPLPLPTKPLSDCQAVKRPPITRGNSGFKVPVYSAHAATLQRLVITICSGFLHSSRLGSHSFPFWLSWRRCSSCPYLLDLVSFRPVTASSGSVSHFVRAVNI